MMKKLAMDHRCKTLHEALLLTEKEAIEIGELCINYISELPLSVIIEKIQKTYGVTGGVYASYIIGHILGGRQSREEILNRVLCLNVN